MPAPVAPSPAPRPLARGLDLAALAVTGLEGAAALPPPDVPGYEITALLGSGGLGHVWKATRLTDGVTVALKIPHAADPAYSDRLRGEAESLRALAHPHILRCLSHGALPDGHPWLALEYVDGAPLSVLIPPGGFEWAEALSHFRRIAAAVIHAHGKGVLHRDLKPGNVLIGHDGSLKVADFGLARPVQDRVVSFSLTLSGNVAGTAEYLAPECYARDYRPAAAADIYALGVILYELLAGHPPRGAWPPVSQQKRVDIRVDDVLRRALDPDPARRFSSGQAMLDEVERIARTPPRYAGTPRLTRAVRVMDAAWTVLGLFMLLAAAGVISRIGKYGLGLPFDLVGENSIRIGSLQALLLLLLLAVLPGVWQLVRLWRFRAIPMREALPSPFGIKLGTTRTAAGLVLLAQVLCLLLPAWLLYLIWRDAGSQWLRADDAPWTQGLVVTEGYRGSVAVDPWQWPEPGKEYSLRERSGWLTDPLGTNTDHATWYPGTIPRLMAGCAIFLAAVIVLTALTALCRWWRFRKWGSALAFLLACGLAANLVRAEAGFDAGADSFRRADPHDPGWIFPAHMHKAGELVSALFPGPPPVWDVPPPEILAHYGDPVDTGGPAPLNRQELTAWLTRHAAAARANRRTTTRLGGQYHEHGGPGGFRSLALCAEFADSPGGPATGAFTLFVLAGHIVPGHGVAVTSQRLLSFPLWEIEPRALTETEAAAWAAAFLHALRTPPAPGQPDPLLPLFLPHLIQPQVDCPLDPVPGIHPPPASDFLLLLHASIARGSRPVLLHAHAPATSAPGGRQRLLLEIQDRDRLSTWTADLIFTAGRWQCVRLTF